MNSMQLLKYLTVMVVVICIFFCVYSILTDNYLAMLVDEGSAFLTENFINLEEVKRTVRSHTICRVLIIPRASYIATCDEFPKDKIILDGNREILVSSHTE